MKKENTMVLEKRSSLNTKRRKRKRIVRWILMPILLLALAAGGYGAFLYTKAETVMEKSYKPIEREKTRPAVDPFEENISVLFIGVDDSQTRKFEQGSRTDALMLATFNQEEKSVKLLSIPRDSYVSIPGRKNKTRINHAHSYGGVELTLETVEDLLDVPIDYYVKMNFNAFIDVIDALNGIEVNVPYDLVEQDSKDRAGAIRLSEGLQTLEGEEALALARTRHYDNDIERGKRQQEIIKAIISKAASAGSVTKYSSVIEAVGDNMTTDLSFDEMKSFIEYATAGKNLNTETLTLAGTDLTLGGAYYYQLDELALDEAKRKLQMHLNLASENESSTGYSDTNDTAAEDPSN
jgi:polyisoprenyl-teichoic acid--peptidoglycan teichoic acid transferase